MTWYELIPAFRKLRDDAARLLLERDWHRLRADEAEERFDILAGQLQAERQSWMAEIDGLRDRLAVYESWFADDERKKGAAA